MQSKLINCSCRNSISYEGIYLVHMPLPPPQPVRAELMQALWSTLHNSDDNVATVAYRVLGKFGGSNRKMLSTPQPVSVWR